MSTTLPLNFSHADRRPIGIVHTGDAGHKSEANPASWVLQGRADDIEVRTPAGVAEFQKRLLLQADAVVEQLRGLEAQGSIVWGIDGGKHGTYLGSPDIACDLNPELNGAVDRYFHRLGADGRKTGGTIRADEFNPATGLMERSTNPLATLARKINYTYRRWKWRYYYIDSNVWDPFNNASSPPRILPPTIYAILRRQFPGIILIPEHAEWSGGLPALPALLDNLASHREAVIYRELRPPGNHTGTPGEVLSRIPTAFSAINCSEGDMAGNFDALVASFRRGDIPLINAWFEAPALATLKEILRADAAKVAI